MPSPGQIQVVLGTAALEVTPLPTASNSTELIPKIQITGVYPVKINSKPSAPDDEYWRHHHDTIVCVDIAIADGTNLRFDVQDVSNQAGWTADLAGQQQCIADINAWL